MNEDERREFYVAMAKAAFLVTITVALILLSDYWT